MNALKGWFCSNEAAIRITKKPKEQRLTKQVKDITACDLTGDVAPDKAKQQMASPVIIL